ncbi:2-amino-4-hydroxy-6-hydroxymethyldihydropteridine diphosphokinase [Pleionea sediminis]|uniref:2-amino-4-hydroxy-6- hydroxymethyldihydropteridine diphosphokinase n=1 Tax=Pleionea sediminis TaxID=2569479 RepID=UPI001184E775|nr:2-amino-4-hydroxy-6-hydroxymethyldihydropteridine diphosphokinase [Pleionea sediminis]
MTEINAFIGVGSNLDNPVQHVIQAQQDLNNILKSQVVQSSSLYRSAPMGPQDQNDYINAVVKISTALTPLELLTALQQIENQHGRVRQGERWGPRTLDLDLLLYGNKSIDLPQLKVPHYGMKERNFVLLPLFEIAKNQELPDGTRLIEYVNTIDQSGIEKLS